jgi:MSHA biogenesis protein MshE
VPEAQALGWLAAQYGIRPGEHRFKRGRGCSHCNSVGLLGRTGIYEMLEMSGDMVAALNRNQTNEFAALAQQAIGEQSLKHRALQLALTGRSPVSEVIRVASELGD